MDISYYLRYLLFIIMITDVDAMDLIARKVCYRHRIRKRDIFLNTRFHPVVRARQHFYFLLDEAGFSMSEIQRYCERYGYPVESPTVYHGIRRMKEYQEKLISEGKKDLVTGLSLIEQRQEQRALKQMELNGE
jgi:hypothetical protein